MTLWLTVINAVLQVMLLTMQSHASDKADIKQAKADQAKGIVDAIASGDVSRINSIVNKLRK